MPKSNRSFKRALPKLNLKKTYFVATEGKETEKIYFETFAGVKYRKTIHIKVLPTKKGDSSPEAVLKRLQDYAKKVSLKATDELWVIIDDDQRPREQLQVVVNECKQQKNYFFAISNPCFELWLLLHQENPKTPPDCHHCEQELTKLFGKKYNKSDYDPYQLITHVEHAIRHAQRLDDPTAEIPDFVGTQVYRLVAKLIAK